MTVPGPPHQPLHRSRHDVTLHSYYNDAVATSGGPAQRQGDDGEQPATCGVFGTGMTWCGGTARTTHAALNETRYILMDYFSPAAITDESGDVTERYQFSAFGLRTILNPDFTVSSASECGMEFSFQGQFEDVETGWMNYGYRYYSVRHSEDGPARIPLRNKVDSICML
jgi:hypothetical protein